jgi:hypothetical protein
MEKIHSQFAIRLFPIARVLKRIARTARHGERSEAIQSEAPLWIASSLCSSQ